MKTLKNILAMALLSMAALLTGACSWIFEDSEGDSSDLHSSKWTPVKIAGQENTVLPEKDKAYIIFTSRDWGVFSIHGCAGDDGFSGRAERLNDDSFRFSPVLSNVKNNKFDPYEKLFIQTLKDTRFIELSKDKQTCKFYGLGFRGARGSLIAEFSRVE